MARFFARLALMFKSFSKLLTNPNVPPLERELFIDVLRNTISEMQGMVQVLESAQDEVKHGTANCA